MLNKYGQFKMEKRKQIYLSSNVEEGKCHFCVHSKTYSGQITKEVF